MPSLPRTKCALAQCRAESVRGSIYCAAHAPAAADAPSRQDLHRYKGRTWQSIRRAQLSRYPLCAACLLSGRTTAADTVDHVWPWRAIGSDAFTRNRMQSLCSPCHSVKTALEGRGICREYRLGQALDWSLGDWATECGS